MSTLNDLVMGEADVGSSEDESYDEETGEARQRNGRDREQNGNVDDSSEEEDDDEDEEEAAKVHMQGLAQFADHD